MAYCLQCICRLSNRVIFTLFWMPQDHKIAVLTMFLIFSFFAPAVSLFMLKKSKSITTIELDNKNERAIPIFLTAIYALILGIFLLVKAPNDLLPKIIYLLPWGGFTGILIAGILTKKDKISLHALGCGFLLAFIFYYFKTQVEYYFEIVVVAVLIVGIIISSRLYLEKHTLKQVSLGFFVGFLSMFFTLMILSKFF